MTRQIASAIVALATVAALALLLAVGAEVEGDPQPETRAISGRLP